LDWIDVVIMLVKILVVMVAWLTLTAYNTLYERKVCGYIQSRYGPNRAGPLGLGQPIADALKLLMKEDLMPGAVNRVLFVAAPIIAILTAIIMFSAIPFGGSITLTLGGQERVIPLHIANINVGILYIFAISSISVYGIVLGGWSSNNKYSLLGGLRTGAQMISYELAMGLGIITVVMMTGSLSLVDIVSEQVIHVGGKTLPMWNMFKLPHGLIGFVIFLIAMFAETNRAPFDLPEAEQELVAGYHTEYSAMKFGGFFVAEYGNMITASAIIATLYMGGWMGLPIVGTLYIPGFIWLIAKIAFLCFVFIWVRWTIPRFRYDQLMSIGWKILLPVGLANVFLVSIINYIFG